MVESECAAVAAPVGVGHLIPVSTESVSFCNVSGKAQVRDG